MDDDVKKVQKLSTEVENEKLALDKEKIALDRRRNELSEEAVKITNKTHRINMMAAAIAAIALFGFMFPKFLGNTFKTVAEKLEYYRCEYLIPCPSPTKTPEPPRIPPRVDQKKNAEIPKPPKPKKQPIPNSLSQGSAGPKSGNPPMDRISEQIFKLPSNKSKTDPHLTIY